jgi:tRNA threonylcarbamoyladenosine biosynthesis protein TsaB
VKILACDTTTTINTVAVCEDGCVMAETAVDCGRRHAERLLDTVDWVLNEASLTLADVDALAVSVGPGSFTGVRVGVSAFKGLALGRGLPLMAVPTLDAMARLASQANGLVCVMLDGKMREVFGAVYRFDSGERTKLTEDRVGPVEDFFGELSGEALFMGDGAALYRERIAEGLSGARFASGLTNYPRGAAVAEEARYLFEAGAPADASVVSPVYLRKSQAEVNRDKAAS